MSIAIKRNFTIPSTSAIGASEIYITSSVASTSVGTGSLQVAGGAGISGTLSLGGVLKLFNDSYYTGFDSAATANTTYIWPATSPATGTSVLSSDAAGNLSWVLMSASGSGLTLNGLTSSTQYFSTSISGSGFTVSSIGSTHTFYIGLAGNASTGLISSTSQTLFGLKTFASGVAITSGTASTSTSTGDLSITGGVGIGGSLWTSANNYSSISGVGISNGVVTGSLTGTATTATKLVTTTLSGTMYIVGQTTSTGSASGTSQFVGAGLSFVSSTGTLTAAYYIGNGYQLSGVVTSLAASTGISVNSSTGTVTVSNTGAVSLIGTANQVLVNASSGAATSGNITLTLPQSIATSSSPSFADITLSTGTNSTLSAVGSNATSLVNKQYVDNLASGLDIHGSVRVLQASSIGASYIQSQVVGSASTGSYLISTTQTTLPSIDGVTLSATGTTQRILITGGFSGSATIGGTSPFTPGNSNIGNGIYYIGALGGSGTSNWILVRATDTDDNTELTGGTFCFIEEGTSYADSGWVCSNDTTNAGPIQFGSTAIVFTQFTGGGALSVGQGLNKVGNNIASKVNTVSVGSASGTGYTQFSIGGASAGGVADTGFYPTFSVRTSGNVSGTSTLTLNSDGFSLVGSTSTNRTLTVTGSDITLTGGGNTLTLTGSISLPSPTQYGIAYGSSSTALGFVSASGSGASILSQTSGSNPVYLSQTQLLVGSATSAATINTDATTATRYLLGTVLNTASGSTQVSVGSGITIGNNLLTSGGIAVTNSTASSSTTSGALIVTGGVGIGASVNIGGKVGVGTNAYTGALSIISPTTSTIGLVVRKIASQTASTFEIQDANGNALISTSYTAGSGETGNGVLNIHANRSIGDAASDNVFKILNSSSTVAGFARDGTLKVSTAIRLANETSIFSFGGTRINVGLDMWTSGLLFFSNSNANIYGASSNRQNFTGMASTTAITWAYYSGSWSDNTKVIGLVSPSGGDRSYFAGYGNLVLNVTGYNSSNGWDATNLLSANIDPYQTLTGNLAQFSVSSVNRFVIGPYGNTTVSLGGTTISNALILKGATSQTGNLMEFQSSTGTTYLYINSSGQFGPVTIASTTGSGSTTTGALIVSGGVGIGGSLNIYQTTTHSDNIIINAAKEIRFYNSSNTFYTGIKAGVTTSSTTFTLPIADGTANQVLYTNGSAALGWTSISASSTGITSLNGLTTTTQTFATSISGSGFTIGSSTSTHIFYIGLAGNASTGLISAASQSLYGAKTFINDTAISSNTVSTSTSTGALVVTGGVGIGGSLWTSSTSYSSISGVGISNGVVTGTLSGTATSAQILNTTTDNASTLYILGSRSNGGFAGTAIYVNTGISALGNTITATTFSGTATSSTNTANTNITLDTTSTIYLTGSRSNASIGSTPVYVLSGVSALGNTITATTFSGTASSAALVNVAASTATRYLAAVSLNTAAGSTQIFTGSGITIGDNRLTVGGLAVTSGTASTNTTTGALTVNGGVGITGQLSINTMALGSTGVAFTPSIVFAGSAGTVITMSVLSDTTLAWEGSSGQLFSIDNNLSTGEIFSVSDISGLPLISASAGQTVTLNEFGGFTQVGNGLASTSTSTGALRVIGGIGITGNAYVGGVINANAGTNSTSTTTGAVIINGGIGVTGNAYVGGVINANAGTNSTSNTSGAVVINGGLGITGNANIGGTFNANNGTNSTSTTTGSLVVNGGIGATGNIYVGGAINANAGTNSTSTTTGAVIINGGLGVTGNSNIGGTVRVTNTTAATGNSSAAFTVAGGAGIGQSLFVAGNLNLTGSVFAGTNTYAKNLGSGDIALDNGSVDSPAILFYWGNNRNMGIDTFYSGSGTTKFRIVKELNESGGGEVWSVDRNGIVTRTAWSPGETINTAMYNYSDLGMASTTTISSTSYTTFATVTYTPKSSSSYLWIEFSCTYTVSGTTGDDFWSNIEVAGSEIVNSNQVWTGQVGGGTRSGVMFPLAARYTNTGTAGIAISVRSKRGTSDDNTTIYGNSASGFMRIQEIGR